MFHLKKKNTVKKPGYDAEQVKPVIRSSICTGEKVAGFKDKKNGTFREVMLIRDEKDLEEFRKKYGIEGPIETVY
ncbi:MAG: aspartate dehydrogenase [Lachnospiraceae bacterium]|nr:aspartate dehydrogenase [Lachnospiraceae bacterium]